MTNERINNEYLEWLIRQVDGYEQFRSMLGQLHEHEFVWLIANDDNRVVDAFDIREEFFSEKGLDSSIYCSVQSVTVLEVLIALSRRLEFQHGAASQTWANQLIRNLSLDQFTGVLNQRQKDAVSTIVDSFVWRRYSHDGYGGIFPLENPHDDQTKVELWYQMSAYLEEKAHA